MANLKRPELKLGGNMSENFKNFELRFHDYCIQADYRNLAKNPETERADYYKKPLLEISALRSAMPDEALQVIRYTIEPQIAADDQKKPWIWMDKLRLHYTGSIGSSLLADRFKFWNTQQSPHESVQEWEVKVRQAGSLCSYNALTDEMCRDKFVFGLHDGTMRAELLKTHLKSDGMPKNMQDVVADAKALESAQKANKLITDATKGIEEQVNWISHKQMKLKREPGTCFWCGDRRGPHPWKTCPANGKTCTKCGINDHFSRVCLETGAPQHEQPRRTTQWQAQGRGRGHRAPRGRSQPKPPREQNVHMLQMTNDQHPVEYYTDDYQEQCYSLETRQIHSIHTTHAKKKYFVTLPMSATGNKFTPVTFQIDTAATCNTLSEDTLFRLMPNMKLRKSPYLLHPYGDSQPLKPLGQIDLLCERNKRYESLTFQILPRDVMMNKPALLSGSDCEALGLITIRAHEIFSLTSAVRDSSGKRAPTYPASSPQTNPDPGNPAAQANGTLKGVKGRHPDQPDSANPYGDPATPSPSKPIMIPSKRRLAPPGNLTKEDILTQYPENFEGLGCLGPPVHFEVKADVSPVQMPIHRVPVAKRMKEKEALDRYTAAGIIKKVEEPTSWCSNEVIKETPKKTRICIDPSQTVNKGILRPVYQMPTLSEQLHKLCHAKCFSLVDVREGFLHVPLDEESSLMTTMHTSYGRYRWLRLPFGISSAPEEFQKRLMSALEGLDGVLCIADDILVFGEGTTYQEAEKDHDRRLVALMERCSKKNIKLNQSKLQFKLQQVKFMGNVITDRGMQADPDKIAAISAMAPPRNKAGVQRFVGMANYLSPYCPNLSTIIRPLTQLTKSDIPFMWAQAQDDAFNKAKHLISTAPVLQYYDLSKPVTLQVDASEEGVGGALLQPNSEGRLQPVAYTSNSLNATEQRYSQIEKECLAICNAFGKFDHWLYGKSDIEVHTDHQPLETICKKPLHKAPARLQKMLMRLQRYRFTIQYKKGTSLYLADTLSRAALPTPVHARVTGFEVFRTELTEESDTHNPRLTETTESRLRDETKKDEHLSKLMATIAQGWPDDRKQLPQPLRAYWTYRDELTTDNGLIYKGAQVMIPQSMQAEMLLKIHANHFGSESNVRMARDVLFWPGMRQAVFDMCNNCSTCAQYGSKSTKEPMRSLPIPTLPWQIISQDIFQYRQKAYLVTVCHFSDWIEVDELDDTLATSVINKTKAHFARFGVPRICHTDNGPQFTSKDYMDFASQYGFKHTTSSPYHSQGNGRAEAAVKVSKSMLKKSDDFQIALLNYRNTPPKDHTYSPAQRMVSRRTRTTLPTADHLLEPMSINRDTVSAELKAKRNTSKAHYDKTAGPEQNSINIGEFVYARPPTSKPGNPWAYGRVTGQRHSRSYTIQTPHSTIRRNRIHIRHAVPPPPQTPPCTPPTLTPRPGHSLANHYNRLGSELNMPTNQPTQQPPPSLDKSNSGPVLDTPSPPQPQEPSTPATGPSELPIDTPLATIQEQPRDHQPEMRTRTRLIKPPTRFKDFELK